MIITTFFFFINDTISGSLVDTGAFLFLNRLKSLDFGLGVVGNGVTAKVCVGEEDE